jgi:hypothetical protein
MKRRIKVRTFLNYIGDSKILTVFNRTATNVFVVCILSILLGFGNYFINDEKNGLSPTSRAVVSSIFTGCASGYLWYFSRNIFNWCKQGLKATYTFCYERAVIVDGGSDDATLDGNVRLPVRFGVVIGE